MSGKSTDANGALTVTIADTGLTSGFFESFDVERYSVSYTDGTIIAPLKADQFAFNGDSTEVTISGLLVNKTNVVVNVTVKKAIVRNKVKKYQRSNKLVISKTNSNAKILENGLTKNTYYGLRVEDKEISLNTIDAVKLIAVYESLDQVSFSRFFNFHIFFKFRSGSNSWRKGSRVKFWSNCTSSFRNFCR